MKVFYKHLPFKRLACVATIGSFDGVHQGHQYIINHAKDLAKKNKLRSLVITFDYHPRFILSGSSRKKIPFPGCITTNQEKISLISKTKVDYLWLLQSQPELFKLTGQDFLTYICRYFDLKFLIVGDDFRFGKGEGIGAKQLQKISLQFGAVTKIIAKRKINQTTFSSSLVRQLIQDSDFLGAEKILGRKYTLAAKVVKGKGIGAKLGFATANILSCGHVVPQTGVYAGYTIVGDKKYLSAINIGHAPTLKSEKQIVVEAHLIGVKKQLLNKKIKIEFIKKIREEKKFPDQKALISAIACDIKFIQENYK